MLMVLTWWSFDPSVWIGLALLMVVFWAWSRGPFAQPDSAPNGHRSAWFAAMAVLLIVALESPIDALADSEFFSVHMFQHLLLMLGVAPAAVLATPPCLARAVAGRCPRLLRWLAQPVPALLLFVTDLYLWHVTRFYQAALRDEGLHAIQHLCFLATGYLFWWNALAPVPDLAALPRIGRMVYTFIATLPSTLLGIFFTFSPVVLYPFYAAAAGRLDPLAGLRTAWGLNPLTDQQVGGLLMWIPGGVVFLIAILWIWSSEPRANQDVGVAASNPETVSPGPTARSTGNEATGTGTVRGSIR